MTITLNGEPVEFTGTVADLIDQRYADRRGLAVAVDHAVVPRGSWASAVLTPGQRVEVGLLVDDEERVERGRGQRPLAAAIWFVRHR